MISTYVLKMRNILFSLPSAFWVLWSGTLINRMGMLVLPFLSIYLASERHVIADYIGFITSLPGIGSILSSLLMSTLADHFERKYLLGLILFGSALLVLPMPFLTPLPLLALLVLTWSTVSEMQRPLSQVLVIDIIPPAQRQQALSILRVAINTGMGISSAMGGLIAVVAFPLLFVVDAITSIIFAALTLLHFPTIKSCPTKYPHLHLAHTSMLFQDRAFLLVGIAAFCANLLYCQLYTIFAVYLIQIGGSALLYGGFMALNTILVVVAEFPLVTAVSHLRTNRTMAVGTLLYAIAVGLCAFIGSPIWLVLPVLAFTLGEMLYSSASSIVAANLAPPEKRGAAVGLLWVAQGVGLAVGPMLAGVLLHISPMLCWWTLCIIGLVGSIFAWVTPDKIKASNLDSGTS
ncbi:MAG: MFS transporter [Ktedonobacteraceae bacterium]|nr:MFS transporter [Ktedonobacteraceae bacterium]